MYGPGGQAVSTCETHGMGGICRLGFGPDDPCTCPPHNGDETAPVPAWHAAMRRVEGARASRELAKEVLET